MCGIAGFIDVRGQAAPEELRELVWTMTDQLRHRGPDGGDVWVGPAAGIALGHRRLAILDLSPAGRQPMQSASGRYTIVFNGEIYNFRALRSELEQRGCALHSRSDTEVMLATIETWGLENALERFNGMFAFALWDQATRTLRLARDRLGEKPLYYGWAGSVFLFGSELKALRIHPSFENSIDRQALALYLRFGYVPGPSSIYEGIRKVPPGCSLTLKNLEPGTLPEPVAYWSVAGAARLGAFQPFRGGEDEAADQLDALLLDAVRIRMESDVPLGAFLSGGVDSSTVVALMQKCAGRAVRSFTIGFHEAGYNEAEHAKRVATHLGTDHTELYVTPREALDTIPELPSLYDEPFADSSQIPTFLVSKLARRSVTVTLGGDGGDELFGGYNHYQRGERRWAMRCRIPSLLRRPLGALLRLGGHASSGNSVRARAARFGAGLAADGQDDFYLQMMSGWTDADSIACGANGSLELFRCDLPKDDLDNYTQRMMLLDSIGYLPDDILVKLDRASMGVSLESRVPLLDHRVVEFAWSLPLALRRSTGRGKAVLRRVLYRYVPRELIERPKQGFSVPIGQWLRSALRDWAEDLLAESRLKTDGYLDPRPIHHAWSRHLSGKEDHSGWVWNALMFQAWLEATRRAETAPTLVTAGQPQSNSNRNSWV